MRYPEDNNFQINKQLMRDRRSEKKGKQRERERERIERESKNYFQRYKLGLKLDTWLGTRVKYL